MAVMGGVFGGRSHGGYGGVQCARRADFLMAINNVSKVEIKQVFNINHVQNMLILPIQFCSVIHRWRRKLTLKKKKRNAGLMMQNFHVSMFVKQH
jgi:hypothetical protein